MKKKTLVLGASPNPSRYSHFAIKRLQAYGHPVIAIGKRHGQVGDVTITSNKEMYDDVDTITLYLNPSNQEQYYDYILSLHPKRIIFNPGTENNELVEMITAKGIEPVEGCTLVMLSTNQY